MCDYGVLDYVDSGEGVNVLFLHGWGANKNSWGNLVSLQDDFHIWRIDLWGFGCTLAPTKVVGTHEYALGVTDFIKNVIKDRVVLIGHSFGGKVAIDVASQTNLVSGLVLIDSAGVKPRFSLRRAIALQKYKRLKRKVAKGKMPKYVLEKFGSRDYQQATGIMRSVLVRVVNEDILPLAKILRVPTLILWGRQDDTTPLYMAKTLHKTIANSRLCVVKGGHFSFLDSDVLSQIYKFLESRDD